MAVVRTRAVVKLGVGMKDNDLISLLEESDYHIDPLGRLVINNDEILQLIHGALNQPDYYDMMTDVGCSNTGC